MMSLTQAVKAGVLKSIRNTYRRSSHSSPAAGVSTMIRRPSRPGCKRHYSALSGCPRRGDLKHVRRVRHRLNRKIDTCPSCKSTTLAVLSEEHNGWPARHFVTLENPLEYCLRTAIPSSASARFRRIGQSSTALRRRVTREGRLACSQAAKRRASLGAATSAPVTKRNNGPKDMKEKGPAKCRPGTEDSKWELRAGARSMH